MSGYLYRGSPTLEQVNAEIMARRAPTSPGPNDHKPQHGTTRGYKRHLEDRTPTCRACREAQAAYKRWWAANR